MTRWEKLAVGTLLLLSSADCAEEIVKNQENPEPWFTGTLLAPVSTTIPAGYVDIEPYLTVLNQYGTYDAEWHAHSVPNFLSVSPLFFCIVGIADGVNFEMLPSLLYNRTQGKSSTHFADLSLGFNLQIYSQKEENWWPGVLISLAEVFPTGKYQKASPRKKGTDISGAGAWVFAPNIVFSRLIHIHKEHYLNVYLTFEYSIPTDVHVKGFNAYGGGFGTRGKVHTGTVYTGLFSFEYSLTRNWAFAFDFLYNYRNKNSFSGKKGHLADGIPAVVGDPSGNSISLAPAIEYNFSETFGIIAGSWFTVAGRNAAQFASGVIAFNWYFNTKTAKKTSAPAL